MLQRYPTPDIPLFFTRIEDCVRPLITESRLKSYQQAISLLFSSSTLVYERVVLTSLRKLSERFPDAENWATDFYFSLLLSVRYPVASAQRLSIRLVPPRGELSSYDRQIHTAARYLRAFTVWTVHLHDGTTYTPTQALLKHELDGLRDAFRFPGETVDLFKTKVVPINRYAVVWYNGIGYKVQLANSDGVLSIETIAMQLVQIKSSRIDTSAVPHVAAYSWRLDRPQWCRVFSQLQAAPENRVPFEILTSSSVSMALDSYDPPTPDNEFLDDVRQGITSENRYSDQTLCFVVYRDGQLGMTADHVPTDCSALVELSSILLSIIKRDEFSSVALNNMIIPEPLIFHHPQTVIPPLPAQFVDPLPRRIVSFVLPSIVSSKRRPVDALLNLSYQAGLFKARPGRIQPIYQPVHQKAFIRGRCDSMWPITEESMSFVQHLTSDEQLSSTDDLIESLRFALNKRLDAVKLSRSGLAPDLFRRWFHLEMLSVLSDETVDSDTRASLEVVVEVWSKFSKGSTIPPRFSSLPATGSAAATESCIHFTGLSLPSCTSDNEKLEGEIVGGLGNVYMQNHLALFYLERPDGTISIRITAAGFFRDDVEEIAKHMQSWYPRIVEFYDESIKI